MSPRAFRRERRRRVAAEQRRLLRSRRAAIGAGAVGAFALVSPATAAADFEVTTLADGPVAPCTGSSCATLRDAVAAANAAAGADTITFASTLSGTLTLTQAPGELQLLAADGAGTTISGAGTAGPISISGDADNNGPDPGDSRIFNVASGNGPATISNLTLTEGYAPTSGGAAILNYSNDLTVTNSTIATNTAPSGPGGGIRSQANSGTIELTITGSTLTGNTAGNGGGLAITDPSSPDKYTTDLTVSDSTISGNDVTGSGAGIDAASKYADTTVTRSTISGNTAASEGGGIRKVGKYALQLSGSVVSGNSAARGGGLYLSSEGDSPATLEVVNTSISGNDATTAGAGVSVGALYPGDALTISHTTISGNDGAAGSFGGGISFYRTLNGAFDLVDSTVSGNTADTGAGVSIGNASTMTPHLGPNGSIGFDNSTIASNVAAVNGGGFYLGAYSYDSGFGSATVPLGSTIVADNTANGSAQDLDRSDTSDGGGFDLAFSLVEAPGDAPVSQTQPSLLGLDPQLNGLAGNGGPTQTMLPQTTSPVVDKGAANGLTTDQRGFPRTVDGSGVSNGADGTDIGSVELSNPPVGPAAPAAKKKKCKRVKKKGGKKRSAESAKKKKKCKKKKKKKR